MKCPKCHRSKGITRVGVVGDQFWCASCNMGFDSDPEEGGDYHDRDVARRLEREESRPKKIWPRRA